MKSILSGVLTCENLSGGEISRRELCDKMLFIIGAIQLPLPMYCLA
jgi:hypothetical protein